MGEREPVVGKHCSHYHESCRVVNQRGEVVLACAQDLLSSGAARIGWNQ